MVNYGGGGIIRTAVTTVTANYTAKPTDGLILGDASVSGAFTVTLPVTGLAKPQSFIVKKIDGGSNQVSVQPAVGTFETGLGAIVLFFVADWAEVVWDGSTWRITAGYQFAFSLRTRNTVMDDGAGNFQLFKAGSGLALTEGANCKMGTAVLNGTTNVVVANTAVTANSRIFLTHQSISGAPGVPYLVAKSAGVSFTITSTAATDLGTVAYVIIEHT